MKLLMILCLTSITMASAQEVAIKSYINPAPIVTEQYINNNSTLPNTATTAFPFLYDNKSILVKKKSYKNIIENTLSGQKYLIFKVKGRTKTC